MSLGAVIDVGSNTVNLLIGNCLTGEILHDESRVVGLGKDLKKNMEITAEAFTRLKGCLAVYSETMDRLLVPANQRQAIATETIRLAKNKALFFGFMNSLGIKTEMISGELEAELGFGASQKFLSGLDFFDDEKMFVHIDIGGGSTEFAFGYKSSQKSLYSISLPLGSVILKDRFFKAGELTNDSAISMRKFIREELKNIDESFRPETAVAVAGTATSLARFNLKLKHFDPEKIQGYEFLFADLENSMKEILNTDMTDLINSPYTDSSRAPVLPAGAILLNEMISFFELNSFFVSIFGIRHGRFLKTVTN